MGYQAFDQYASEYDAWFLENINVLETELRLVAACLKDAGSILSIGCGSALFEKLLEDRYGIMTRCGLHCAPAAHRSLGTFPQGTVRFAPGYATTPEDIAAALAAVEEIAGEKCRKME